jgi:hypothetical protein
MAGCAPEETGAIAEDGADGAAAADGPAQPALESEVWNNKCCHWTCTNWHGYSSATPGSGACAAYANYWCVEHNQGHLMPNSTYWGVCE